MFVFSKGRTVCQTLLTFSCFFFQFIFVYTAPLRITYRELYPSHVLHPQFVSFLLGFVVERATSCLKEFETHDAMGIMEHKCATSYINKTYLKHATRWKFLNTTYFSLYVIVLYVRVGLKNFLH